ncbi:2-hydroxyacid dehydrogenase [Tateyamaria pelophila]|uniref:2-hydroxyacid dehydrogenase n=1 Tax=Tateyamaria pelophila TaxID=328415 RepID=UPI001CBB9B34|nr:glyoxylate/hydroxypyruvate reductase A [Tateyamaria pelophila]
MTSRAQLAQHDVVEGVYLSASLDLPDIFGPETETRDGIRLYRPEDVPDPARIRFALAWNPAEDAFDAYPNIGLVQVIAAGVDGVLSNRSLPKHAVVARVHDKEQAAIMAGFAAWHVVWHHRQMGNYIAAQQASRWDRQTVKILRPPSAVTVGILGYGLMGQAIAQTVASMEFPVLVAARSPRQDEGRISCISGPGSVEAVAARADILINILPLTDATQGILDAGLFARMPKGAALIQLGRGNHLVEEDLLAALTSGQIGGASLDVFRQEPLPADHPFWSHPMVFITPHEASITSAPAVIDALEHSLEQIQAGQHPSTAVDRKTGY